MYLPLERTSKNRPSTSRTHSLSVEIGTEQKMVYHVVLLLGRHPQEYVSCTISSVGYEFFLKFFSRGLAGGPRNIILCYFQVPFVFLCINYEKQKRIAVRTYTDRHTEGVGLG